MQSQQIAPPPAPVVPATSSVKVEDKENYRTGHGCLMLSLMILAATALVVAAVMIFATPTT